MQVAGGLFYSFHFRRRIINILNYKQFYTDCLPIEYLSKVVQKISLILVKP
jgi:hypothetical protein